MDEIFTRRSVRKFKNTKIEDEKITQLLRAGMQAPSAVNQQPWEFIVVTDKEKLKQISEFSEHARPLYEGTAGIIVLGNTERMVVPAMWEQDLGAVVENILLEAVSLGLGAVWLGTAPVEKRMKFLSNYFNLKQNIKPYAVIALGYPKNENDNKFEDRFDEARIHYEEY